MMFRKVDRDKSNAVVMEAAVGILL